MCKESTLADTCPRCKRRMYYAEQHLAVCDVPAPVKAEKKKEAR